MASKKVMLKINFRLLGKKWSMKVLTGKEYKRKHGKDSLAVTMAYKRRIHMHPSGLDLETITHEVVHAYISEICLKSTNNIEPDDWEEIFAELVAKRGQEMLDLSKRLHGKFNSTTTRVKNSAKRR